MSKKMYTVTDIIDLRLLVS
ncbi:Protein of unknown function [Lactobacillus helveticus CIRM-BIA 101]|nr:Protein of unknown function [Lactobacillus helveticus CIRM-BIA 101]